jgi:hypothetical protein
MALWERIAAWQRLPASTLVTAGLYLTSAKPTGGVAASSPTATAATGYMQACLNQAWQRWGGTGEVSPAPPLRG